MRPSQTIVINAAGRGARLGLDIPKCLVEVGGHALLEYQLSMCKDLPDVRIVVGFRADDVVSLANRIRDDLTYVYNPHYRTTGTLSSLYLGSRFAGDRVISLDGDMLVDPDDFLDFCNQTQPTVGVCQPHTDEPVYVRTELRDGKLFATEFSRQPIGLEWTGLLNVAPDWIHDIGYHVYECAQRYLPLPAVCVDACEIDTPNDLQRSRLWIERRRLSRCLGTSP